jgi:hypothetical protein
MLGELIAEAESKNMGSKVLADGEIEVTTHAHVKYLGIEGSGLTTYWLEPRPDGSFYMEGNAIVTTKTEKYGVPAGPGTI